MVVNGSECDFSGGTVAELLNSRGLSSLKVAVELNGKILPRDKYDTRLLDTDKVEIASFVQGG